MLQNYVIEHKLFVLRIVPWSYICLLIITIGHLKPYRCLQKNKLTLTVNNQKGLTCYKTNYLINQDNFDGLQRLFKNL